MDNNKDIIDWGVILKNTLERKKLFLIVWPIVFVLSCLWIFPQPRYYACSVSLAPETAGENMIGGLSAIASNFGVNIGSKNMDAIYPTLYPELINSNSFIIGLFNIKIKTDDGLINTDYYTYLSKYQKRNWLTQPIEDTKKYLGSLFVEETKNKPSKDISVISPFRLSEFDYHLADIIRKKVTCYINKKTDVITITVKDQDKLVCATLADSVRQRLQNYIIEYRTSKARLDVQHFQNLVDSAKTAYDHSTDEYSAYCDSHQDMLLQSFLSERDKLENDMQIKFNTYNALCNQLEVMKVRLQEKTPAFTTLQNATVPIKPAGPKRLMFVIAMLVLSTAITCIGINRKELCKLFNAR